MAALQAFPALTQDEFSTACKALEQRSEDKLNDTKWLSVKWTGEELLIRQTRKAFCNELNPGKSEGGGGQMDEGEDIEDLVEDPGTRPEVSLFGTGNASPWLNIFDSLPRSAPQKICSSLIVPSHSHLHTRSPYCGSHADVKRTPCR